MNAIGVVLLRCGMMHSIPLPASKSWKAITPDSSVATSEESRVERRLETVSMESDSIDLGSEVPVGLSGKPIAARRI